MSEAWVALGAVIKPHGVRGALRLHLFADKTSVLRPGLEVKIGDDVHRVLRVFSNGARIEIDGLTDRDIADALRGREVSVRRDDFPDADDDEFYLVDLIGAQLFDPEGTALGEILSFSDNGAQPVANVKVVSGQVELVPFVTEFIVELDVEGGRVVMDLPEGLLVGEADDAGDGDAS